MEDVKARLCLKEADANLELVRTEMSWLSLGRVSTNAESWAPM